ncbi:hypothetical protein [Rufibacter roseus]|uniref:Uncharacterized protein n=1 Tax=Rufibacter roseus TaxID=1567108 RepID=A0ABW2DUK5_9BACT|nr:hypothetical protein [Rufibacter roseus]
MADPKPHEETFFVSLAPCAHGRGAPPCGFALPFSLDLRSCRWRGTAQSEALIPTAGISSNSAAIAAVEMLLLVICFCGSWVESLALSRISFFLM